MLKKTLLILLAILVHSASIFAEPPAEPPEITPSVEATVGAMATESSADHLEPFLPVLENLQGTGNFSLGGCGSAGHQDCIASCATQTQECMNACSTPLCYFQCRNQEAFCVDLCDNQYGCCC